MAPVPLYFVYFIEVMRGHHDKLDDNKKHSIFNKPGIEHIISSHDHGIEYHVKFMSMSIQHLKLPQWHKVYLYQHYDVDFVVQSIQNIVNSKKYPHANHFNCMASGIQANNTQWMY
jgi:hypothetical protein